MPELSVKPSLNAHVVDEVMAAARQRAAMLGATFTIAIVDDSATPRALFRMDSADLLTVGLALGKARLVASNGMPSKMWRGLVADDAYLGLTVPIALDRVLGGAVLFAGGYPFQVDGTVVGAIGVSGGSEAQDDEVARAGLAALTQAKQFTGDDAP
ncbi:MAG: cobalamin adenosyltransferase [Pseudonocardiales bacterium]|nr:MAG: cobalamin adenosyltransferase [Pseudonocardiales bacterium]